MGFLINKDEYEKGKDILITIEREFQNKLPERGIKVTDVKSIIGKIDEALATYSAKEDISEAMPNPVKEEGWEIHPLGGGPIKEEDLPKVASGQKSDADGYYTKKGEVGDPEVTMATKIGGENLGGKSLLSAAIKSRIFGGWVDYLEWRRWP